MNLGLLVKKRKEKRNNSR